MPEVNSILNAKSSCYLSDGRNICKEFADKVSGDYVSPKDSVAITKAAVEAAVKDVLHKVLGWGWFKSK